MILAHFAETWRFRKAEWLLASVMTGLGVVYVINPGLFERPYFATMRGMMQQHWWALCCLLIGLTRLCFLFINGAFRKSPPIRCMAAAASCGVWTALTIAAVLNDFSSQGLAIWPVMLVFDIIVIHETAREWGAGVRRRNIEAERVSTRR